MFCMFQKMMMKKQRGRRPSKPKGKGLLCCLRRNAKPKILKKINSSKRRKKPRKKKENVLKATKKVSNVTLHVLFVKKSFR
jgi:hypothetical protein